jgi:hypothetical protein
MSLTVFTAAPLFHISCTFLDSDWPILDLEKISNDSHEAHSTQRETDRVYVAKLMEEFVEKGVLRVENPGIVIGLREGWNEMKKSKTWTLIHQHTYHSYL